MKLTDLFITQAMDLDLPELSKDETLQYLAEKFHQAGGLDDVAGYVEALKAREAQSTTGVGDEIAIPHAQDAAIEEAAIIFGRSSDGIEWESFDGQPAKLIFMIAAPEGGGEHLAALAKLSSVLMNPDAKAGLLAAESPEEVLAIIDEYDESDEEETVEVEESETVETPDDGKPSVLAVTACPTGIAHTFMAEEKLKQAAEDLNVSIKVETNGQAGIGNRLTQDDIANAKAIIVAADKQVEMARFDGKPVIIVPVADGINKATELIERAEAVDAPIYHASQSEQTQVEDTEDESLARRFYKHLMNGVSHMLPFVVAGGILIALSFFWGIHAADPSHATYHPMAGFLNTIGGLAFAMMLPMLAGYIGQSIADRPGLVVGVMGGIFADPSILAAFNGEAGVFEGAQASGFLGALVAGFLAGGIIIFLRKALSWMPRALEGMKPIFLYPVLGVLLMALIMFYIVNAPMGAVMTGIENFLNNIPREWSIVLGFLVAAMMSIDMGGPINKAAYVTGTALVTQAAGAGSDVMAAVMVGGMVPPTAIAIAATIKPDLFGRDQRNSALINYVMGAAFITEGAIPFVASNPLRMIPSLAIGAGVSGAISMLFSAKSYVPHGGIFAVIAGGVSQPLGFITAWIIGSVVGALLLVVLLKQQQEQ